MSQEILPPDPDWELETRPKQIEPDIEFEAKLIMIAAYGIPSVLFVHYIWRPITGPIFDWIFSLF